VPRIRALAPRSRIVVVSAHAGAAERARVLAAGVDAFLTKPVRLDELWSTVVGGAPVATELPDYFPDQPGVFHEIQAQFRRELPAWEEAARVACGARDFAAVRRHAHYLRNSALAIRAPALFDACAALETAATNRDSDALGAAWRACQTELERWRPATA
jgi:CheY-like chemotaxis protein